MPVAQLKTDHSTTVHLRVPVQLRDRIQRRADEERRPWTQMAVILLEDAVVQSEKRRARPRVVA